MIYDYPTDQTNCDFMMIRQPYFLYKQVSHNFPDASAFYPVGQCRTQRSLRRRYPGEHVMQSLGDGPLQVEQAWSQGKQYPSSILSATCLVLYVPAGHSSTQVLS